MENQEVRLFARGLGVPLWKVCNAMGISEPTLTRKLRTEFTDEEKEKIKTIILELSKS